MRYEVFAMAQRWEGAVEIARTLTKLTPSAGQCWVLLANAIRHKAGGGCVASKCKSGTVALVRQQNLLLLAASARGGGL